MKKYVHIFCVVAMTAILTWCSSTLKTTVNSWMQSLLDADKKNEQWLVLTREDIYDYWEENTNSLKLNSKELVVVPDICSLMDIQDHKDVRYLDLSDNSIRIVDQDLTCLVNLKSLNLSYNEIETVKNLWVLPSLNEFKLQKNNLTSISWLPDFPALEKLNVWFNQLSETLWIEKYTSLKQLELYHNQLESVIWLENLENLKELKVEFNNIKDFGFVDTLKQQWLELMTAKWNEIKDSLLDELKIMNNDYLDQLKDKDIFDNSFVEIIVPKE